MTANVLTSENVGLLEDALIRRKSEKSYYEFFKWAWPLVVNDELEENWHIKYLCDELQIVGDRVIKRLDKEYDLIINIAPGESKSTIATIIFYVWLWIRDPTIRIITASYSATLSLDHAVKSRDLLKEPEFQRIFGPLKFKKDQDVKSKYKNEHGGERSSTSVGGTVTGMHGDIIGIDDPTNPQQAESEAELKTAVKWINKTISNRKTKKSMAPTIMIMQRLSEGDPAGDWLEKRDKHGKRIKHICLPADDSFPIYPEYLREYYVDGLMNPIRTGRAVLKEQKTELGSRGYAGQYGQSPAPPEGNIIKGQWIQYYDPIMIDPNKYRHQMGFYLDSAYTEDEDSNDPSAFAAYWSMNDEIYFAEVVQVWMEFPELLKYAKTFIKKWGIWGQSVLYIEPKASGKSIYQMLKKDLGKRVVKEDKAPVASKPERAYAVSPKIEAGLMNIPIGKSWTDGYVNELLKFPGGKHDDQVDVTVAAIRKELIEKRKSFL